MTTLTSTLFQGASPGSFRTNMQNWASTLPNKVENLKNMARNTSLTNVYSTAAAVLVGKDSSLDRIYTLEVATPVAKYLTTTNHVGNIFSKVNAVLVTALTFKLANSQKNARNELAACESKCELTEGQKSIKSEKQWDVIETGVYLLAFGACSVEWVQEVSKVTFPKISATFASLPLLRPLSKMGFSQVIASLFFVGSIVDLTRGVKELSEDGLDVHSQETTKKVLNTAKALSEVVVALLIFTSTAPLLGVSASALSLGIAGFGFGIAVYDAATKEKKVG